MDKRAHLLLQRSKTDVEMARRREASREQVAGALVELCAISERRLDDGQQTLAIAVLETQGLRSVKVLELLGQLRASSCCMQWCRLR